MGCCTPSPAPPGIHSPWDGVSCSQPCSSEHPRQVVVPSLLPRALLTPRSVGHLIPPSSPASLLAVRCCCWLFWSWGVPCLGFRVSFHRISFCFLPPTAFRENELWQCHKGGEVTRNEGFVAELPPSISSHLARSQAAGSGYSEPVLGAGEGESSF